MWWKSCIDLQFYIKIHWDRVNIQRKLVRNDSGKKSINPFLCNNDNCKLLEKSIPSYHQWYKPKHWAFYFRSMFYLDLMPSLCRFEKFLGPLTSRNDEKENKFYSSDYLHMQRLFLTDTFEYNDAPNHVAFLLDCQKSQNQTTPVAASFGWKQSKLRFKPYKNYNAKQKLVQWTS